MKYIKMMVVPAHWPTFFIVGLLLWIVGSPIALLTQHMWAPFQRPQIGTLDREVYAPGDPVRMTWDLHVLNRYPAAFTRHVIHTETGRLYGFLRLPPSTGRTGQFRLVQTIRLPDDAQAGEWCWISIAEIDYNALLKTSEPVAPICFDVVANATGGDSS